MKRQVDVLVARPRAPGERLPGRLQGFEGPARLRARSVGHWRPQMLRAGRGEDRGAGTDRRNQGACDDRAGHAGHHELPVRAAGAWRTAHVAPSEDDFLHEQRAELQRMGTLFAHGDPPGTLPARDGGRALRRARGSRLWLEPHEFGSHTGDRQAVPPLHLQLQRAVRSGHPTDPRPGPHAHHGPGAGGCVRGAPQRSRPSRAATGAVPRHGERRLLPPGGRSLSEDCQARPDGRPVSPGQRVRYGRGSLRVREGL